MDKLIIITIVIVIIFSFLYSIVIIKKRKEKKRKQKQKITELKILGSGVYIVKTIINKKIIINKINSTTDKEKLFFPKNIVVNVKKEAIGQFKVGQKFKIKKGKLYFLQNT